MYLLQVLSARSEIEEIVMAVSAVFKSSPEKIVERYVGRQESNAARQVVIYHQGKMWCGRTPLETMIDDKKH